MIQLPKPVVDVASYIAEVVAERQAGINAIDFQSVETAWIKRCQDYDDKHGEAAQLQIWPAIKVKSTSFKTLYASPAANSVQEPVLNALRDRSLTLCPMCGEAGTPNTLDHYLPLEYFPEFSILPFNLVPACDICQLHKLSRYIGSEGRLFLHPYYDSFLIGQVAQLKIHPPYNTPTPELVCHATVTGVDAAVVERHLRELQLHARFKASFKKEYIRLLRLVHRARGRNRRVLQSINVLREHAADKSVNCWEHILYESVVNDADLLDYLATGQLPAYL